MNNDWRSVQKRRSNLSILLLIPVFVSLGVLGVGRAGASEKGLGDWLEDARAENQLIALAGLVLQDGEIVELAAVGHRKKGDPTPVTTDDRWHLGSNTKAMTATVIARLVERGVLGWDDPIADLLPDIADGMHPDYRNATLDHILSHRAGLPAHFPFLSRFTRNPIDDELPKKRRDAVAGVLEAEPLGQPGSAFLYSNVGYTLAGVIAEKATGLSWGQLIRQELFKPLGMTSAGFGAPGSPDGLDQPWGHQLIAGLYKRAAAPGPWADNDAIICPAGCVHLSLQDWAAFIDLHLQGEAGSSPLLGAESFERLHRAALDDYAYGWVVDRKSKLADGDRMIWHNGSNTMWYTLAQLWPERNTAFLFASNDGDLEAAQKAMKSAGKKLAKRYLDR